MAKDGNHTSHGGVREYIIVALILGVITYVEYAIIEFDIPWLGSGFILWALMIMSIVKFVMVIMFFMHLKDDDVAYTGFFSVGMLMALGTFVAFAFMMTAPASIAYLRASSVPAAEAAGHGDEDHGLDESARALIDTDGYSRDRAAIMDAGRPKDQTLRIEPPAAPDVDATLAAAPSAADAGAGDPEQVEPDPPAAGADPEQEPEEAPAAPDDVGEDADDADDADEDPDGDDGAEEGEGAPTEWDRELGEQVYGSNCASCHQANGNGIPGAFPPLAEHAAEVASVDGGRTYLIDAVLFGLQGPIEVQGSTYDGVMPAWAQLSDEEVAAVVNHTVFFDDGADVAPVAEEDVAERRDADLDAQDVHDRREELALP